MNRFGLTSLCLLGAFLFPRVASATKSAELYTSSAYGYGRFEARMRVTAGDGVVSAFFLWKDGSEQAGTFWNELDYEKIGASCQLQTNALYGNPSAGHSTKPAVNADLCGGYHVYSYEWTADYIAWSLDGTELRRETGATAAAYAQNASAGMQIHFNIWPGDSTFGGNLNPSILPVHQYIDWVQFSSYANGAFTLAWREDFSAATAPSGWLTGDWVSPKNLSTHDALNVNFLNGFAVLSMTADDATGPAGAMTEGSGGAAGMSGTGGSGGIVGTGGKAGSGSGGTPSGGTGGAAAGTSPGGATGSAGLANSGGGGTSGTSGAAGGAGGATAVGGTSGSAAMTGGAGGAGAASSSGGAGGAGAVSSSGGSGAVGGGASGSGNSGGTAGEQAGVMGGAGATAGQPSSGGTKADDASGCGCRVPGSGRFAQRELGIGSALLLTLAGAFGLRRRVSRARGSETKL